MLGVRNPLNFPSCVYVWVMNHLGVVFGDAFRFFGVFGWIYGKMDEIIKFGQFRDPTPRRRDPTQRYGREEGLDKPQVHRGVAVLRRSVCVATVHNMESFVFWFVLFFYCYEDSSIGLMRTL